MGSWQQNLVTIYNNVMDLGNKEDRNFIRLAPIYFKYQKVGIKVFLRVNNNKLEYIKSTLIDDKAPLKDKTIIMPSNIRAEIRTTSTKESFPLVEVIKWVCLFDKNNKKAIERYESYKKELTNFSDYSQNGYLKLLAEYIDKNTLLNDLIQDSNSAFDNLKEEDKEKLFVQFIIYDKDKEIILSNENDIITKWSEYCKSLYNEKKYCIDTNELSSYNLDFPRRNFISGQPKLISCNDKENFTYRGRIKDKSEACNFSFENILKAQNVLDYLLINKIGINIGKQFIIIAAYDNPTSIKTINPDLSSESLFDQIVSDEFKNEFDCDDIRDELDINYSQKVHKALNSRIEKIVTHNRKIFLLGLQAVTSGRLSITFYQELMEKEYLENIANWHYYVNWEQESYSKINNKYIKIVSTPSINDILEKAYKCSAKDESFNKYINNAYIRLLNCIFYNRYIPLDILSNLFIRANNPISFKDKNNSWSEKEWLSHVRITCSLFRKAIYDKKKEFINMNIDEKNTNRSYVWGRILATLNNIELWARKIQSNNDGKTDNRPTNVIRLFNTFVLKPYSTFKTIREQINPYIVILQKKGIKNPERKLDELVKLLEDYKDNKPLEPDYLFGYYLQRSDFYNSKENKDFEKNEGDD